MARLIKMQKFAERTQVRVNDALDRFLERAVPLGAPVKAAPTKPKRTVWRRLFMFGTQAGAGFAFGGMPGAAAVPLGSKAAKALFKRPKALRRGAEVIKGQAEQDKFFESREKDILLEVYGRARELSSNPQQVFDHLAASNLDVQTSAPHTAAALSATSVRALQHIKLLGDATIGVNAMADLGMSPTPFIDEHRAFRDMDPMTLAKFKRGVLAVFDPLVAVDALADGSLSAEEADAIRQVYPKMYGYISAQLAEELQNPDVVLDMVRRQTLAKWFGRPVGRVTSPGFIRRHQSMHQLPSPAVGGNLITESAPEGARFQAQTQSERLETLRG